MIQDVFAATGGSDAALRLAMKRKLKRIASMRTRMAMQFNCVPESQAEYDAIDDYEHAHRCAEHEGKPEQRH